LGRRGLRFFLSLDLQTAQTKNFNVPTF
jgi:hypothetical protein